MPISTLKKLEQFESRLFQYQDLSLELLLRGFENGKIPREAYERELNRRGLSHWQAVMSVHGFSESEIEAELELMLSDPTVLEQYPSGVIESARLWVAEWHRVNG